MRALLDTNIIIHRESAKVVRPEIGVLFRWLDQLKYEKCVHPDSIAEIRNYHDSEVVDAFNAKIQSYSELRTIAPDDRFITEIRQEIDNGDNDRIDTNILKEVYAGRVDILITEDRGIHRKAQRLEIDTRVFSIDAFLEKVNAEYPELTDYKVLSARKKFFGDCDISDPFFDSFKFDYPGFKSWFNRKSDEIAYVCTADDSSILAFLYLKLEDERENYDDIEPRFVPRKRLKIGTFKVISNGFKIGERFLQIIFDNALKQSVDEIYTTIFDQSADHNRLIRLLEEWGFNYHGIKRSKAGEELVFVRKMAPNVDQTDPRLSYPYVSGNKRRFLVSIYPKYHTELLPDSILRTESPMDFEEDRPNRNAISKVFISRSIERDLVPGDIIVFYRTASGGSGYRTSVVTTLGVVQHLYTNINSEEEFIELCRKRSVFTDNELREHWNYRPYNRPFIVNFLYVCSFGRRMNLEALIDTGVLLSKYDAPRGFKEITNGQFQTILDHSDVDRSIVVY